MEGEGRCLCFYHYRGSLERGCGGGSPHERAAVFGGDFFFGGIAISCRHVYWNMHFPVGYAYLYLGGRVCDQLTKTLSPLERSSLRFEC